MGINDYTAIKLGYLALLYTLLSDDKSAEKKVQALREVLNNMPGCAVKRGKLIGWYKGIQRKRGAYRA